MGLSASCQSFERFSSALQWIMTTKYGARMSHILDDFFFIGPAQSNKCSSDLSRFISICEDIGIPLKQEKTVWPTSKLVIYGIEVDSTEMVCRLPLDKVLKIRHLLNGFSRRKKSLYVNFNRCLVCLILRQAVWFRVGLSCAGFTILLLLCLIQPFT